MELFVEIKKKLPGFALNVSLNAGQDALGLLGASGSGKSMTLRCIAGIDKPDEGRIVLNGRVLFDSDRGINVPSRLRRTGYLFQNYALFPNMTVEENIGFGLGSISHGKRQEKVRQKIGMLKLDGLEKRLPFQLSGGQQQRVALARALAVEPEVLLLDEPFSASDDHLRSHLLKQLQDTLADYQGVTLFVTHNMEEAYRICSSLVVLRDGGIEASGDKESLFMKPPTLATAQMTGCKNFSAARRLPGNQIQAVDWGVELTVKDVLMEHMEHVGIRANYIRLAGEGDRENVFECWPKFTSESPFRMTIYLSLGRGLEGTGGGQLQWEVSKDKWIALKDKPLPWRICLSPDKLIIM